MKKGKIKQINYRHMKNISIFIILAILSLNLYGKITLPSVFADNMVLQQNSEVAIWGWSEPGETLKIVSGWNTEDTISVKANNYAKWETKIKTSSAGGPYTIEILGSSTIKLNNVMLGEVWLCSGQSNMGYTANQGIDNGDEEIAKANYPNIRIFNVPRVGANYPQLNCEGAWQECSPETMKSTSIIGYIFGKELHEKLDVPVGIIVSAWGGTPAEVWIEKERVDNNSEYDDFRYQNNETNWPSEPGATYNGMIAPLIPYGIAGAIWYQGESNCKTYPVYASMMKTLIENWRDDFNKEFPFYFVQIAPYDYGEAIHSELLREQQEITTKIVPKTGMIVITDLADDIKNIHPTNKIDVGERLANYALAETYKQDVGAYKSPMYKEAKIEKGKIRIFFDNIPTGLMYINKSSTKFMIAGSDKKFVYAKAKIDDKTVIVYSNDVKNPVAVRFCFDNISTPDVFSNEGLPVAPFRTDVW